MQMQVWYGLVGSCTKWLWFDVYPVIDTVTYCDDKPTSTIAACLQRLLTEHIELLILRSKGFCYILTVWWNIYIKPMLEFPEPCIPPYACCSRWTERILGSRATCCTIGSPGGSNHSGDFPRPPCWGVGQNAAGTALFGLLVAASEVPWQNGKIEAAPEVFQQCRANLQGIYPLVI